jgi:hypothetical protein
MKPNDITATERAQITFIIVRIISELAGGQPANDAKVAAIVRAMLPVCHVQKTPWLKAVAQLGDEDWLLTILKLGDEFNFEAKIAMDVQTAELHRSVIDVAKPGIN